MNQDVFFFAFYGTWGLVRLFSKDEIPKYEFLIFWLVLMIHLSADVFF